MNLFGSKNRNSPFRGKEDEKKRDTFLQGLVEENYRNRLWITIITMLTFLLLLLGIGYSMYANTPISNQWKEILLLVLGAFIGAYQKVIDFWFQSKDLQRDMLKWADEEDEDNQSKKDLPIK